MARVPITVNGRRYDIGCDDGQEDDVRRLADDLDRRVSQMAASVGQVGDSRLLVMTGLLMAHELEQRSAAPGTAPMAVSGASPEAVVDDALCAQLERLAARIEAIARKFALVEGERPDDTPAVRAEAASGIAAATESP